MCLLGFLRFSGRSLSLVAFQTQTPNRRVLATQLSKSQAVLNGSLGIPFTSKFLQINYPPVFFFTGIRCGTDFFVTPVRSSGSRVDIAQKPNKSGQILDQRWKKSKYFVIFTKLIPRRICFCIAKILVLMVLHFRSANHNWTCCLLARNFLRIA